MGSSAVGGPTVLIFGVAVGILILAAVVGGVLKLLGVRRAKARQEAAQAARMAELQVTLEAQVKIAESFSAIGAADWKSFAELPNREARKDWLCSQGVHSSAFGLPADQLPTVAEHLELEEAISRVHFRGIGFEESLSVSEIERREYERLEQFRRQRAEEAEERRRSDAVERNSRKLWQSLSKEDRRGYSQLRSNADRQRWISEHGGSALFGLQPSVAFDTLAKLSQGSRTAPTR